MLKTAPQKRPLPFKAAGLVAVAIAAMGGIILLQSSQLKQPSLWAENPAQAAEQERLRLQLLKQTPTFGFDNVMANWVFLNFLQYYGDDAARNATGYGLSPDYFDYITRLDPRFVMAYLFLSGSVSHRLGKPDVAVKMMQRGTDALSPQMDDAAFQVWRLKALDQLLLLGDIPGAIESYEQAANWTKGTSYAEIEPILRGTANFLRTDPNSKPVRVMAWGDIYQQAMAIGDQQTADRAKRNILSLGGKFVEKDGNVFVVPPPRDPDKQQKK